MGFWERLDKFNLAIEKIQDWLNDTPVYLCLAHDAILREKIKIILTKYALYDEVNARDLEFNGFGLLEIEFVGKEVENFKIIVGKTVFDYLRSYYLGFASTQTDVQKIGENMYVINIYYSFDKKTLRNFEAYFAETSNYKKQEALEREVIKEKEMGGKIEDRIKIGVTSFDGVNVPVTIPLKNHVHWLICGGSGSGKSVLTLYILNQLMDYATELYIADFKRTNDYVGIASKYAGGSDCTSLFMEYYRAYEELKAGKKGRIWFLWDEMAGNLLWQESQDKKLCQEIKNKMGEILMMGRELAGGASSAGIISILQRPDSSNFSVGSRENYHVKILLGASSAESRKMMGFSSDEIPKDFKAGVGKGMLMTDEDPVPIAFTVPQIDKGTITRLLQEKAL